MSDETTKKIIERITINYAEPTKLPSGHISKVFYDCMMLTPNDFARLAAQATGDLDQDYFDLALGIAYGGLFFAAAVAGGRGCTILQKDGLVRGPSLAGKKVIVVDDVVYSGNNLLNAKRVAEAQGATVVALACIIDRSGGKVGHVDHVDRDKLPLLSAFRTGM